ncbi:MAG: tetratricopeptide repeat protein [Bacteroidota bacterium]
MQRLFLLGILWGLISCGKDNETQKQRFLLRGNEALKQQNYREAKRFYDEALVLDSCYVPAINNLGILAYQSSRYGEAVLHYDRAIDCDPTFMDAQINRANAFYELNELFRALDDLAYVEKQLPDTSYVHFMKGLVLTKMRKYKEALMAFNRTVTLDSANAEVWVNRGSVHYYLGELDKAQDDLDQALQLDPLESNAYNALALIEIDRGNFDEALKLVNNALDFEPIQPYFLNNRGYIHLLKGDFDLARKDIDQSITIDPENAWAYRNKGWYYFNRSEFGEAIRLLKQATKLDPFVNKGHQYLAEAHWANNDKVLACDLVSKHGLSVSFSCY